MAPFINQEQAIFFDDESSTASLTSSSSTTTSTSSCLAPPAKRSVSFCAEVTTHDILHINEFSLVEQRDSWYSEADMLRIRQEWKETVVFLDSNVHFDEETTELCGRGLEGKTSQGRRTRKAARSASMRAVLDEQVFQEMDGEVDHIMIAMAYSECCFPLQKEAYARACQDHLEARAIHDLPEPTDQEMLENNDYVGPTKFDFESVRRSFEGVHCDDDGDATMAKKGSSVLEVSNINNGSFLGLKLRDRFSCFLPPVTPKRYGRRVKVTTTFR